MKNKKWTFLNFILVGIIILGLSLTKSIQYNGASLISREKILNMSQTELTILSESLIDDHIICEVKNSHNQYGYALFKPAKNKGYTFVSSMLTDKDATAADFIWIGDTKYELFLCDQPELDYIVVNYTDTATLETATKQFPLINNTIAIVEAPNLKSYRRAFCFYDVNGNKYE